MCVHQLILSPPLSPPIFSVFSFAALVAGIFPAIFFVVVVSEFCAWVSVGICISIE